MQACRQAGRQAGTQVDRQAGRQAGRQETHRETLTASVVQVNGHEVLITGAWRFAVSVGVLTGERSFHTGPSDLQGSSR